MSSRRVRPTRTTVVWLIAVASFFVRQRWFQHYGAPPSVRIPPAYIEPQMSSSPAPGPHQQQHIVVAHCTEDLRWLNQYYDFNPNVCHLVHFHIYSKCNKVPELNATIPAVSGCSTLHVVKNFGTEEYAYLSYIEEHYDALPPTISFVQGGALTENPHIFHDTLYNIPGMKYKSLSRFVDYVWHWVDYKAAGNGEKKILDDGGFLTGTEKSWISDYRGMFSVSSDRIKRHKLDVYAGIRVKIQEKECETRNCCMESFASPLFGCEPTKFQTREGQQCMSGVHKNVSNVVFSEDYGKDGCCPESSCCFKKWHSFEDTNWANCGTETILYAMNHLNGALICIEHASSVNSTEYVKQLYLEMLYADAWRANLTGLELHRQSQWQYHEKLQW